MKDLTYYEKRIKLTFKIVDIKVDLTKYVYCLFIWHSLSVAAVIDKFCYSDYTLCVNAV